MSSLTSKEFRIWWSTWEKLRRLAELNLRTEAEQVDWLVDQELQRLEQLVGDSEDDEEDVNEETG